ncbi:MAG: hypothetical protein QHH00_05990 [Methanomassiliicoccales archaeon]|nr:hypothetical protein [Methanomassiliicoccales archaeon]
MKFERNIRLEKFLEALVEQYTFDLGEKIAKDAPCCGACRSASGPLRPAITRRYAWKLGSSGA